MRFSRFEDRTAEQLTSETQWLRELQSMPFAVPAPIPWDGEDFLRPALGESYFLTRTTWCPGRVHRRPTREKWFQIGTAMAHLHAHTLGRHDLGAARWDVDEVTGSDGEFESGLRLVEEKLGHDSRLLFERLNNRYQQERNSLGSLQLIHADLHPGNVLFGESTIAIVDFDDCGFAPALYDLVVAITEMAEPSLESDFLAGYGSVRPSPYDLKAIPLVSAVRWAQEVLYSLDGEHARPQQCHKTMRKIWQSAAQW